jgi:iron-sulfur cluster repair protein YtfE (RIC family)
MEKDYYALLAAHHQRLLSTVEDLGKRVEEDVLNTPELLTFLWERLIPHAQGEEATLYKRAEILPGGSALVQPMLNEHKTIVQHIREVGEFFATRRDAELHNSLHSLLTLFRVHFHKEEDVLIPLLRRHLTPEEFGTLIEETHQIEQTGKPSDVKRFMDADHRRIDRILEEFSILKRRVLSQARMLFTRSKNGLLRHVAWEEELLFPAFEEKTNLRDTGPTVVMRQEHAQIKAALERIEQLLNAGELTAIDTAERELVSILTVHNQKEERILYPMINQSLSVPERKELLDKLR